MNEGVLLLLIILGVITWILWIFLPFAIFGIKTRLDKLIELNEKTVNNLAMLPEAIIDAQQASKVGQQTDTKAE